MHLPVVGTAKKGRGRNAVRRGDEGCRRLVTVLPQDKEGANRNAKGGSVLSYRQEPGACGAPWTDPKGLRGCSGATTGWKDDGSI